MVQDKEMWDEEIFEIKVGGINGLSFFVNQVLKIYPNGRAKPPVQRIVSNILRKEVEEEVVYQVFSTNMDGEDPRIQKVFIGLPVYITFKI